MINQKTDSDLSGKIASLTARQRPLRNLILAGPILFLGLESAHAVISAGLHYRENYAAKISSDLNNYEKKGPQSEISLARYNHHETKGSADTLFTKITIDYPTNTNNTNTGKPATVGEAMAHDVDLINDIMPQIQQIVAILSGIAIVLLAALTASLRIPATKFMTISLVIMVSNMTIIAMKEFSFIPEGTKTPAANTATQQPSPADTTNATFGYEKFALKPRALQQKRQDQISDFDISKMEDNYKKWQSYSSKQMTDYANANTPSFEEIAKNEKLRSNDDYRQVNQNNVFTTIKINFYYQWLMLNHFHMTDSEETINKNYADLIKITSRGFPDQVPTTLKNLYQDGKQNLLSTEEIEKDYPADLATLRATKKEAERKVEAMKTISHYSADVMLAGIIALLASLSLLPSFLSIRNISRRKDITLLGNHSQTPAEIKNPG